MKKSHTSHKKPTVFWTKRRVLLWMKTGTWFSLGAALGLFFFTSFFFIYFQFRYAHTVYPGVFVKNVDFGGKQKTDVQKYFAEKNEALQDVTFTLVSEDITASISAKDLAVGFDEDLLSQQAYSIGRSNNFFSNLSIVLQAYTTGIFLSPAYRIDEDALTTITKPLAEKINTPIQDALFKFENGRVTTFRPSINGQEIDATLLKKHILEKTIQVLTTKTQNEITIQVPIKELQANTKTEEVNNLGIKELVASGTSLYTGSIANRIYNLSLAATRLNGVLIRPGETFSFTRALGDISSFTGYKQAYVIQNGKTVLGDGGGVCQVSTTLFRAALNAGLPIIERNPHAYRVHYYEEDTSPGIDAAVFSPNIDLKFKNDTGHYLLIQTAINPAEDRLTFELYGTKDTREVMITKPVIVSQTPAPAPLFQDDPTLSKGIVKQVDFAAAGASVYFTRSVTKNGEIILSDKFVSNYRPWQAIFLRGTKE